MIKTDALTGFLTHTYVSQEEKKPANKTLYNALRSMHKIYSADADSAASDELPPDVMSTAASLIKQRAIKQIIAMVEQLADTLALARDAHKDPTPQRLKKLNKRAEKAAENQETLLSMLNGAIDLVDFDHIAETLVNIGKRQTAATASAVSAD